jgi:hypothetical protein
VKLGHCLKKILLAISSKLGEELVVQDQLDLLVPPEYLERLRELGQQVQQGRKEIRGPPVQQEI